MSLSLSLNSAISGLRAAQNSLAVISNNVSNAKTAGYTKKVQPQVNVTYNGMGAGVVSQTVYRQTDELMRREIRKETSTQGRTTIENDFLKQIQTMYGKTESGGRLGSAITAFNTALNALSTTPESSAAQLNVVSSAKALTLTMNDMAQQVTDMRTSGARQVGDAVTEVNTNLQQVQELNRQITRAYALGQPTGDLEDTRDLALSKIAENMDIQTFRRDTGEMVVFTKSGRILVDGNAVQLSYSTPNVMGVTDKVPAITINGQNVDIKSEFRDGKIAGLINTVDNTLSGIAGQLNQLAESLYGNSARTTGVVDQPQYGPATYPFGRLNTTPSETSGTITNPTYLDITRSGSTLQLGVNFNIGDTLTFSNGATARVEAVDTNAASANLRFKITPLSGGFSVSSTAPVSITQVNGVALGGAAANITGIDSGYRFFTGVDLTHYTSTTGGYVAQNNAASIAIHPNLDPSQGGTAALLALANDPFTKNLAKTLSDTFTQMQSVAQNIGGVASGNYTYAGYATSMVSQNAIVASKAAADQSFQVEFVRSLQSQSAEIEGVNVDEEMANLVTYQNAYSASARVVTTISEMFDTLLGIKS